MNAQFTADASGFADMINRRAIVFGIGREEAFRTEGRLLADELIQRTPPFSGKSLVKMLGAQGKSLGFRNLDVAELSAQRVGHRRVEKDIRHIAYGLRGARMPEEAPTTIVGQTNPRYARHSNRIESGILQRVRGKNAVRVYATKDGTVYGVDQDLFMPNASHSDIAKFHNFSRIKNGRVTAAAKGDLVTGRWKWLNRLVTKHATLNSYIRKKQRMVGQAKGGWAAAFMRLGGRMSANGWIGRHGRVAGRVKADFTSDRIFIEMINRSRWSRGGDDERIIPKAIAGRAESLKAAIWRQMNDAWRKGGSVPK